MLLDKSMSHTLLRASFSAGLRRAKTTEICDKEGLCLSLLRSCLPTESFMNGRERPCENSTTDIAILPLDYAFR